MLFFKAYKQHIGTLGRIILVLQLQDLSLPTGLHRTALLCVTQAERHSRFSRELVVKRELIRNKKNQRIMNHFYNTKIVKKSAIHFTVHTGCH